MFLTIKCVLMLKLIEINIKMDLALNNLQRFICHKTKPNNLSTIYLFNYLLLIYITRNVLEGAFLLKELYSSFFALFFFNLFIYLFTFSLNGVPWVSKLDWETYTSEFESHLVLHSYGLVPHLSKKLSKLLLLH